MITQAFVMIGVAQKAVFFTAIYLLGYLSKVSRWKKYCNEKNNEKINDKIYEAINEKLNSRNVKSATNLITFFSITSSKI